MPINSGRLTQSVLQCVLAGTLVTGAFSCAAAVTLKPKNLPLSVLGVQISVPVTVSFDAQTTNDHVILRLTVEGNLQDLQDKALTVARALPVPKGNCDRTGVNPVVNSIDMASIAPAEANANVTIGGHVTAWICSKIVGQTIKTTGPSDSVQLGAQIAIDVVDKNKVGLRLAGPATIKTGNALTKEAIDLLGINISDSITDALTNALDTSQAQAVFPSIQGVVVVISDATFAANGSTLLVRAHGTADMNSDSFSALLDALSK